MISPTPTLPTLHSKYSTVIWRFSLVSENQLHFSCWVSEHTILLPRLELCSEVTLSPPAGFSSDTVSSKEPPRAPFRSSQIVFRVLSRHAYSPLHFCYHSTKWTAKFTFKYLLSPRDCKPHWTRSAFIHHCNPRAWHNAKHLVGTQDYYLWKELSLWSNIPILWSFRRLR